MKLSAIFASILFSIATAAPTTQKRQGNLFETATVQISLVNDQTGKTSLPASIAPENFIANLAAIYEHDPNVASNGVVAASRAVLVANPTNLQFGCEVEGADGTVVGDFGNDTPSIALTGGNIPAVVNTFRFECFTK